MIDETKECIKCSEPLAKDVRVCPKCGEEQPVMGLVYAVYVLLFLFVQGFIYRLVWPEVESTLHYAIYFAITFLATAAAVYGYTKMRGRRPS